MATIEKEKALDVVRQMVADGQVSQDIAEKYFPELAESEDERMRKFIIKIFKDSQRDGISEIIKPEQYDKIFAWLEAQGNKDEEILVLKDQIESLNAAIKAIKETHRIKLEKQGEQKPTDKFPKYDKGDILTDGKHKYEVLSWDYTETGIAAYYMKGVGCKFSWNCEEADKKLYIVEQKPWSKEDNVMLDEIIDFFENGTVKLQHDLSLYASWLKSLKNRYTWKPSDEQMHYLSWIANVKLGDSVVEQEVSKHLNELYTDLKKLKA